MFSDSINRVVVRKGVFAKEAKESRKEYVIQVRELVVESIVGVF